MFKILIVEDNLDKLRDILKTLEPIYNIDDIEHVVDSFEAKKKIKEGFYDLLILDIAIPLRKSEVIDLEGGIKLLKEIYDRDFYKIPSHIIGLTFNDEIFSKATSEFGDHILSVIRYSETDIEWQKQLLRGVESRIKSKLSLSSIEQDYDYDIAIITAVEIEFNAIKALSDDWIKINFTGDSSPYFETNFVKGDKTFRVIAACAPQMGMNASAVLSIKMIYNFRPKYIFMTGILASVQKNDSHGYGDIFIIDESWDGGAGKITQDENGKTLFLQTANNLRLDKDVSEKMRSLKDNTNLLRNIKDGWKPGKTPNTELSLHIGSVASVAGVVENEAIVHELKVKDRKLLGLEMEAHGVYYSAINCSKPRPIAVAIKSVTDFANVNKSDDFQAYASYTSARIMYEFIISELM